MIEFTVTPHKIKQRRTVKVYIYDTVADLRRAANKYDLKTKLHGADYHNDTLGVTHRFERINVDTDESHPNVAIIRLAATHLTTRIISHEAAHASVWIYQLDVSEQPPSPDVSIDDEEHFCHLVSDITSAIVDQIYKRNLLQPPIAKK